MKKIILYLSLMLTAFGVVAQESESMLNEQYREAIREYLNQDIANRQKTMQRRAEQMLLALPNDQKLYDESHVKISTAITETEGEDGVRTLDYMYVISYDCRHLEGYTDDYPQGVFDWDSSNSCRAICTLTKTFIDGVLDDYFKAGKQVTVKIFSTADGSAINGTMPYDGRYGDFRYEPVTFNGEQLRISVDRQTGIVNNAQLAYLRAQSVRHFLQNNVRNLQRTVNSYQYITRSYADTGAYYRRSSIAITVHDAFRETIDLMTADKIQDDYVDFNIPQSLTSYENAYVLIIANEDYDNAFLPTVPYAANDGEIVRRYFVRALGVPERQVKVLNNASKATILNEGVHWLTDISQAVAVTKGDAVEPQANIFIYYAGHGYTDFNNVSYLMPNSLNVDNIKSLQPKKAKKGCCKKKKKAAQAAVVTNYDLRLKPKESAAFTQQLLSIDQLCSMFKGYPVKNLTLIVDAGMDGKQRNGAVMLRPDRKVDPKAKKAKKRKSNMRADAVVLLAADADKTAYSFDAQHHGFLTYFLLKEVKGIAANIESYSYQDIYESVERKLSKESALQGRWQEISGMAGGKYKEAWQQLHVK